MPLACKEMAMNVTRRSLFESKALQIGMFEARPTSDACGAIEWQTANVVVLPFRGVFSKHDAPGRYVIGTPSHAVLIAADTPYRLSFPGAIGDRALIFRFDEELAPEQFDRRGNQSLASQGMLPRTRSCFAICSGRACKTARRIDLRPKLLASIS
jgi:hypothetical protein